MRTWMRLVAAMLLILPFAPARLYAADPELNIKKEDFQKLLDKLDKLQSDTTANGLRGNRTAEDMRAIREELGRIRELLEHMAEKQGVIQRQSGYGPGTLPPGGAIPTTGTIMLENTFLAPATVHINGQAYSVAAGQTRMIRNHPVGPFQYFVDVAGNMVGSPHSETLRPEGYRIQIFARLPF